MAALPALSAARSPQVDIRNDDCLRFLRGLPDRSVDVITTDPAYSGMNRHMMFGHGRIVGRYREEDNPRWFTEVDDDEEGFLVLLGECHRVLREDRHIYVMFDSYSLLSLGHLMRVHFDVKGLLVWDKVRIGMGHHFRRRHEHIVFASKGRRPIARRDLPDVLVHPRLTRAAYPTQKPVGLFGDLLRASAEPGFVVCDPFVGSGSAAIAALRAGCDVVAADLSAAAVELTRDRCEEFLRSGVDPLEPSSR